MGFIKRGFHNFFAGINNFFVDHKKIFITLNVIAIIALIIALFVIISSLTTKITISIAEEDIEDIIGTKARTLSFSATGDFDGKAITSGFTWEVSAGSVSVDGSGIATWQLPTDEGTYSITASYEDDSATKYITILGNELSELYKNSDYEILCQDTDGDGLTDLYEASVSGTSQTEKDSDGDGLYDGDEILMDLDPLSEDSKGDGLKDGERKLEYEFSSDEVTVKIIGTGNLVHTSVDKYTTETTSNVSAILEGIYSIYTEAQLSNAEITIGYEDDDVSEKGLTEGSLAVYELDESTNTFNKLKTTVDTEENTLTFTTEEFGKYFIADSSKLTSNLTTELVFLLDNSGSMYSKDEYEDSEENDPDFMRVDLVNDLIDKLEGNYKFGAGKFTFEYTELSALTSDKDTVKNKVSTIKTLSEKFTGTYIGAGIQGAISQFTSGDGINRRYIILLSDGSDEVDKSSDDYDKDLLDEQIEIASERGIKIYTIGLGDEIDEDTLKDIADRTDGKYYCAATAEDLADVFNLISAELNYNLYDTDGDGEDDSVIIADSGFLVGRDGFSFSNFSNSQVEYGYSYGMVLYAKLFYENSLPTKLGAKKVTTSTGDVVEAPAITSSELKIKVSKLRKFSLVSLSALSDLPTNFWASTVTDNTLTINSTIKAELVALGFTTYAIEYNAENAGFKAYESIQFDMNNILLDEDEESTVELEDDDVNMLKVLARLDIAKYRDEKFYFYDNNDTAFEQLKETLESGETVMIRINDDYTVLAVKLLADSTDMNKYKIEVYDPNYAGVAKYIEVERYKFSDIAEISKVVTDEYEYKFSYQGVDVGICISVPNIQENN